MNEPGTKEFFGDQGKPNDDEGTDSKVNTAAQDFTL